MFKKKNTIKCCSIQSWLFDFWRNTTEIRNLFIREIPLQFVGKFIRNSWILFYPSFTVYLVPLHPTSTTSFYCSIPQVQFRKIPSIFESKEMSFFSLMIHDQWVKWLMTFHPLFLSCQRVIIKQRAMSSFIHSLVEWLQKRKLKKREWFSWCWKDDPGGHGPRLTTTDRVS